MNHTHLFCQVYSLGRWLTNVNLGNLSDLVFKQKGQIWFYHLQSEWLVCCQQTSRICLQNFDLAFSNILNIIISENYIAQWKTKDLVSIY